MQDQNYEKKISILDWGIVFSAIFLLLAVYIPQSIWKEEEQFKKESRHRMEAIANAQEFYFELTGNYTKDGKHLFELVEAAMDSLIADSLFTGNKVINLKDSSYPINLDRGFEVRVDTTFSSATELYHTYDDTVYTVGLKNRESGGIDTLFVNIKDILRYESDENFHKIYFTDIVSRTELRTDYLRNKYHLENKLLKCPLTNQPYVFEIDTTIEDDIFTVKSPLFLLEKPYKESRFIVFSFEAGMHGYVKGNQKSWAD
tara:strand:+ start:1968 stop:2741 length:774 start_codon:yes stop_codon:yes gene_type:complete